MVKQLAILSCDENFFPLAKGLVLSIKALAAPPALALVDIGLAPDSLKWMAAQGVTAARFDAALHYAIPVDKQYRLAQLCRPLLPAMFPGYDVYTWIDSDIWIQDGSVLAHHAELAARFPDKAVLSPCIDASYKAPFQIPDQIVNAQFRVYQAALGDDAEAKHYAFRPILSSGLFSMAAAGPLWGLWKQAIERFFSGRHQRDDDIHGLEQMAFNYVLYKHDAAWLLDATYNYHCHECLPFFDEALGKVRVAVPPNRVIGAVHLSAAGYYMRAYLQRKLLFDQGRYLTPEERQALEGMGKHYEVGK
jgi:hypothetical protein